MQTSEFKLHFLHKQDGKYDYRFKTNSMMHEYMYGYKDTLFFEKPRRENDSLKDLPTRRGRRSSNQRQRRRG